MSKQNRWATKEEAYAYAKAAERSGNLGLAYASACDYLGWDISIRREIMAKHKYKAHRHVYSGNLKFRKRRTL